MLFYVYKEKSQEDFMNKKTIFKIVGCVLAGIIVIKELHIISFILKV